MTSGARLSPVTNQQKVDDKIREICDFWSRLHVCEETGATTWDVLERLERDATEALAKQPPDLKRADAATAEALLRITGIEMF
jgi:hypothetical protein